MFTVPKVTAAISDNGTATSKATNTVVKEIFDTRLLVLRGLPAIPIPYFCRPAAMVLMPSSVRGPAAYMSPSMIR